MASSSKILEMMVKVEHAAYWPKLTELSALTRDVTAARKDSSSHCTIVPSR